MANSLHLVNNAVKYLIIHESFFATLVDRFQMVLEINEDLILLRIFTLLINLLRMLFLADSTVLWCLCLKCEIIYSNNIDFAHGKHIFNQFREKLALLVQRIFHSHFENFYSKLKNRNATLHYSIPLTASHPRR